MVWLDICARFHVRVQIFQWYKSRTSIDSLSHWGRVMHICVSKLTIIGSDNSLSSSLHQAIIWTNVGILLIRTLGTNFSEIGSEIHAFSFKNMHLKMLSAKWRKFYSSLNALSLHIDIAANVFRHYNCVTWESPVMHKTLSFYDTIMLN